jgi:hypothetical protein
MDHNTAQLASANNSNHKFCLRCSARDTKTLGSDKGCAHVQNMGMSYLGAEVSDEELEAALMREVLQHNPPDDPWYALERADFDSLNLVLDDSQFLTTFARFLFVALAALLVWRMTQYYRTLPTQPATPSRASSPASRTSPLVHQLFSNLSISQSAPKPGSRRMNTSW